MFAAVVPLIGCGLRGRSVEKQHLPKAAITTNVTPAKPKHSTLISDMSVSRESTATVEGDDVGVRCLPNLVNMARPERAPEHLLRGASEDVASVKRLIVAVDFGTTYSAVAYVALEEGDDDRAYLDPSRIRTVQNYPDDATFGNLDDQMRSEVPTEVIYPLDRHFREKAAKGRGTIADSEDEDYEFDPSSTLGDEELLDADSGLAVFGQSNSGYDADQMSIDDEDSFRWGYSAHEAWGRSATHAGANSKPLSRFKLLLDDSPRTEAIRADLGRTLDELKTKKIIQKPLDVIVDFLTSLMRHAKSEIKRAGFDDSYKTEIVLCVPAIWTQKALRDMQGALGKAMTLAGFPGIDTDNNTIDNLFIVSEPEAAAAFVLTNERDISVCHFS